MTSFFGPLLAAAMVAQFQGGKLQGTVVDDQGKPVDPAEVLDIYPAGQTWFDPLRLRLAGTS